MKLSTKQLSMLTIDLEMTVYYTLNTYPAANVLYDKETIEPYFCQAAKSRVA